jgi:DNA transformation protein
MRGLGPSSEALLATIDINSAEQLKEIGAIRAFLKLKEINGQQPNMNLLYAMVGALEDESWLTIAQQQRYQLLMALDGFEELERQLSLEGLSLQ